MKNKAAKKFLCTYTSINGFFLYSSPTTIGRESACIISIGVCKMWDRALSYKIEGEEKGLVKIIK